MFSFRARHRYPTGFELDAAFTSDGLVTALFGPSGSGKTSIVEMIAGLRQPDEGRIAIGDRVLFDRAERINCPRFERKVGLVAQDQLLFPHLTVQGNLRYGQSRQNGRAPIDFDRVLKVLELRGLIDRSTPSLSGGERQRVALGRAILSGPELLLMDEPLAALDDSLKGRIIDYLEQTVAEWRIPTLLVSHNAVEVRRLAEQVVVLDQGKVISVGKPEAVLPTT